MSSALSALFLTHTYLLWCLVLLGLSVIALRLLPDHRRLMLLGGLLSCPCALFAIGLVPEYWQPTRIAVMLIAPEDVLFSFATGILAVALAVFPVRRRLSFHLDVRAFLRFYVRCALLGLALHVICGLVGLRGLESHVVPAVVIGAILLFSRPSLWLVPLAGGIGFLIVHLAVAAAAIRFRPHFLLEWNLANLSGVLLLGVPVEEALWACAFGAVFPLFTVMAVGARLEKAPARSVPAKDEREKLEVDYDSCA
jgi:hypothetical protein